MNIAEMFDRQFRRYFSVERYSLFNEDQHPRDQGGRFALKGVAGASSTTKPKVSGPKPPIKFGFDARPPGTVSPMDFEVKKQPPSLAGQKTLAGMFDDAFEEHFPALNTTKQKSLFRRFGSRDRYASAGEKKWITIGAGEGKKGTHVQIDGKGNIAKGPQSLRGENVSNLPSSGKPTEESPFSLKREKADRWFKHKPKQQEQGSLFKEDPKPSPPENYHPGRPQPRKSDGRIVGPGLANVKDLKVDPHRFQYKLNTDNAAGVTDQFSDIAFNPELAGTVHVWHDHESGETYVVNGHHRTELANRSGYGGDIQVFYLDAADAQEARAKGAIINIAGGNGTAVDAAKFMRDTGADLEAMNKAGVSVKGAIARDAGILAGLSEGLFTKVARGEYRMGRALAIAKYLPDHDQQNALDRRISKWEEQKGREISDSTVEEMAEELSSVPKVKNDKNGVLFLDAVDDERSVDVERAQLKGALKRELSNKLNAFKAVSSEKKADILSSHNQINTDKNRQEAESLSRLLDDFNRESKYKGPVGDLLNNAALELANAPTKFKPILGKLRDDILGLLASNVQENDSGGVSEDGEVGDDGVQRYKPAPGQKGFFGRRFWEVKDFCSRGRSVPGIQRNDLLSQFNHAFERHFRSRK